MSYQDLSYKGVDYSVFESESGYYFVIDARFESDFFTDYDECVRCAKFYIDRVF